MVQPEIGAAGKKNCRFFSCIETRPEFSVSLTPSPPSIERLRLFVKSCRPEAGLDNMEAVTPRPTVEELKALRVVDLRQRLAQVGLPQSGEGTDQTVFCSEFLAPSNRSG